MERLLFVSLLLLLGLVSSSPPAMAAVVDLTEPPPAPRDAPGQPRHCGAEGVWLQLLGSGEIATLDDERSAAGFVVWHDSRAVLLVDPGPGTALRFDEAGAEFADLEAIALSQLGTQQAGDLPALLAGSIDAGRDTRLQLLGPDGTDDTPGLETFMQRLIGAEGAFPALQDLLTFRNEAGYKLSLRPVPATGRNRWSGFSSRNLRLAATPVHHGTARALAWRADIGDKSITFAGAFSNQKDLIRKLAADTDALVVDHAIPDHARGLVRDYYVTPGEIGRIAAAADVRFVILARRGWRTRGVESQTREAIEENFSGPVIFGNELECWGL